MRIAVAPGSYKSTITSLDATDILSEVLQDNLPDDQIEPIVMTDGGEGTIDAFAHNFGGSIKTYRTIGPLREPVHAEVCWVNAQSVIVESAKIVGYSLIPSSRRNPWQTSSAGVGYLIRTLIADGAQEIIVTMGDSAIMDMGIGMLDALGANFYSDGKRIIEPGLRDLAHLTDFTFDRVRNVKITCLVDTKDYLCGPRGQASTYGAQKGLVEYEVAAAEAGLARFSRLIEERLGIQVARLPMGTGSGGLAAALHAFHDADLSHTPEYFDSQLGLSERLAACDYVITGEGYLDDQTRWGKVPYYVTSQCAGRCIAVVGGHSATGLDDLRRGAVGGCSVYELNSGLAMSNPRSALAQAARSVALHIGSSSER
ncbi:glycerate kinase [Nocardia sp. BMG51109]|uniref:glycerate kinase n=1 Tax=Nocardia sp. BMG51109 TaxID=1056816 RepID=UPI0018DD2E85|nr:glycerate kinase [Nocardia sp. BMG51109]